MTTDAQIPIAEAVKRVPRGPASDPERRSEVDHGGKPRWVNISFFRGAELDDPDGLLLGTGKGMRHMTVREPNDAASPALKRVLREAFKLGGRDLRGRTPAR